MQSSGNSYGVLEKTKIETWIDLIIEEVKCLGYSIINSGLSKKEFEKLSDDFNKTYDKYITHYGLEYLKERNEHNTIRLPLALDDAFLNLAKNQNLLRVIERLIAGKFILNQQNGIINPSRERYNQDSLAQRSTLSAFCLFSTYCYKCTLLY